MICKCTCDYGAKTHNIKINEDQQLIQFLMGLDDVFTRMRVNILMMKPLPSITHAYSIILHKVSQREVHYNHNLAIDSFAFMSSRQKWTPSRSIND